MLGYGIYLCRCVTGWQLDLNGIELNFALPIRNVLHYIDSLWYSISPLQFSTVTNLNFRLSCQYCINLSGGSHIIWWNSKSMLTYGSYNILRVVRLNKGILCTTWCYCTVLSWCNVSMQLILSSYIVFNPFWMITVLTNSNWKHLVLYHLTGDFCWFF